MTNLTRLAHKLDPKTSTCRAVVETPKGSRAKFDYDPDEKLFRLKSMLPEGMSFPLDFGFVPSTVAGDRDPTDVMILVDEPLFPGAVLDIRLIGVIEAEEHEDGRTERNDRLLAAAVTSLVYGEVKTPDDLPEHFIDNMTDFWVNKDRLEGKEFKPLGVQGPSAAVALIEQTSKAAKKAA